jgi:hypothetical protein
MSQRTRRQLNRRFESVGSAVMPGSFRHPILMASFDCR